MAKNGVFSWRRRSSAKIGCIEKDSSFSINQESHDQQVHVLAVDDSLVDRKFIERLLKITSCKVTTVDSGRNALQFLGLEEEKNSTDGFEGLKVDLIITDYCMPGMTGFELLKKIKGSSAFRQVPVVIMSSENVLARIHRQVPVVIMSSENVLARIQRCLEEGAEDFIVKPVKLSDVKRLKESIFGDQKMNINPQEHTTSKRKSHPVTTTPSSVPSSLPPVSSSSSKFSSSLPPLATTVAKYSKTIFTHNDARVPNQAD